ncbi:MAG: SPW repeat protein [Chloroflexota bacterium]|nr:SPW repeat protein [Chloroflexota bacterium]
MWAQLASTAIGLWLMAAPAVLGYGDPAKRIDHIVGPVAASFAFIAVWEVTRSLRWVNVLLGAWLLVAPWVLGYATTPTVNSMVVGTLLIVLASVRGEVTEQFGGGWSSLLPGHAVVEREGRSR